jgi:hypothetical protein
VGTPGFSRGAARVLACAAAAARPMAVRSCAGAFVWGAPGSNACPAGSVRIEAEAACRTAAAAAGKTVGSGFVGTYPDEPRGCYYFTGDNYAFFNAHAFGAGNSDAQLLCAAAVTTGAPPPHRYFHCTQGYSHCTAHPANYTKLLRVVAALFLGRNGQRTSVLGIPEYGLCGPALSSTHGSHAGIHGLRIKGSGV